MPSTACSNACKWITSTSFISTTQPAPCRTSSPAAIDENETENTDSEIIQIFTIDGKQVNTLQNGVNILRMSDGSTKKVVKTK